jgi:hypothetical protein
LESAHLGKNSKRQVTKIGVEWLICAPPSEPAAGRSSLCRLTRSAPAAVVGPYEFSKSSRILSSASITACG